MPTHVHDGPGFHRASAPVSVIARLPDREAVRTDLREAQAVRTWTALIKAGHTGAGIRAQLNARRWQRCGHAIVLHNGPLTRLQHFAVARVHAGPRAIFTAFTAAELHGLTGWTRPEPHVLMPRGARRLHTCPTSLVIHRTRDWDDVRSARQVHALADALVIAASSFLSPRPACGLLAAAVQQRLVRSADLRRALTVAIRTRHRAVLLAGVADIAQGADALSEIDFVRLCRRFGLPQPMQQVVRRVSGGRRRYLDATWRRRDGRLVVVEIDGALHLNARNWWDDQDRQNEIALGDALILRFPSVVVRTDPQRVADQLRRALLL